MNNILCPIDFSDASLNAMEYAVRIGEVHHSSIKLVHIVTPEEYNERLINDPENAVKDFEKESLQKMNNLLQEVASVSSIKMSSMEVLDGRLIEKLQHIIKDESISLVVMGTEGVNDIVEAQVGSNTLKLIEESEVPILCVPAHSGYKPIKKMVYGSEFSMDDKEYLQPIINFAYGFDARLIVSHITNTSGISEEEYNAYISKIKSYFVYEKLSFEQFNTEKDTHIALEHILNAHDADLLILVHKKRNFLKSLFHRSLTKRMSYMTNFPLLVLRN